MDVWMTREQAAAKFGGYTPRQLKRHEHVLKTRDELVCDGTEPTPEKIKERGGFASMGTVYSYLQVILALEGAQAEPKQADAEKTEEPFSDAITKLTTDAKQLIDSLGESFMVTIKAAVEEGQRRSQVALQTHIDASEVALREAKADVASARKDANVMADESESFSLKNSDLEEERGSAVNERDVLDAALQETRSLLKDKGQEIENALCRVADKERLEEFLRFELEQERCGRQSTERELKAEFTRRHEAEMSVAKLQEQLDARFRETLGLRADMSDLRKKLAMLEGKLFETVGGPA